MRRVAFAGALLVLAACGAQRSPPVAPASGVAAADDRWSSRTWEDRHDAMTFLVLPNMARLFQRHDAAVYPTLTCRSCHGADAEEVQYRMPHGLPHLDPSHLPGPRDPDPKRAATARFMIEEVTPQMADLLGVPVYDPRTGAGFSCFNCHPASGKP